MLTIRLAVVVSALAMSIACGSSYSSSPASPSPTPSPSPAPAPGGPPTSVTIPSGAQALGNRAFAPDDLAIATGTTVTWTNSDSVAHTSTSDTSGWDSGIVAPGGHFSFTFATPGSYSYHCTVHPGMVGIVVVH